MREGRARRLIVNIPPRHLKSLAASIALPAWLLGHDPTLAIVNATYAQDLSDAFARDCRAIDGVALVPGAVSDPPSGRAAAAPRADHDEGRVPDGDLGRRGADRARGRRDPDRRSAEARRRDVGKPPRGRQRLVRRHALFAAQRQDEGLDRHRDAAPARGRSRRPCAQAGGLGDRGVPGDRGGRRDIRNRDAVRSQGVCAPGRRSAACRTRIAGDARAHPGDDRRIRISPASISSGPRRRAGA